MSANSYIFNPTESTSAVTGDGFSVPRLTTTGRLAITFGTGDKGMMVYDTTLNSLFIWNGSAWELIDGTGTSSNTEVLFNDNGAPAGDPTMVFNKNTDTLTVQNLVVTGTTTALGGLNASSIRAAASDYAAVTFDGTTANTRVSSTLTGQSIGTGDFSIWCRFKISQTTAKVVFSVVEDANNYFGLTTASGAYGLDKTIGGVASNATITGFTGAAFAGQIVDFVLVRSAGVFSVYINGSAYTLTNTTGNISLSAAANFRVGGYFVAFQVFDKDVYRAVVFNRALSAGDVTELITVGVNPADQWGTQTGQTSGTLVASKRYRITTYVSADSFTNVGAASNATGVEFVATGTTPTTWTNASTLNRIGGLVDLDFTVGAGYQATDRSTNQLNGTLFNGVSWTMPETSARLYATTAFSGNSQMLGTLAIPTNALIEDIVVYTTGNSTVFVGNASGDNSIVGATAIAPGYNRLTLSAFRSSTGNLWVNCTQPDTLRFTIVYSIAQP